MRCQLGPYRWDWAHLWCLWQLVYWLNHSSWDQLKLFPQIGMSPPSFTLSREEGSAYTKPKVPVTGSFLFVCLNPGILILERNWQNRSKNKNQPMSSQDCGFGRKETASVANLEVAATTGTGWGLLSLSLLSYSSRGLVSLSGQGRWGRKIYEHFFFPKKSSLF